MRRRVLLDEDIPEGLREELDAHRHLIRLVQEVGLGNTKNGVLLRAIERSQRWDVFITGDQSIPYQHSRTFLQSLPFGIIVIHALRGSIDGYLPFAPKVRFEIGKIGAGELSIFKIENVR